MTTKDPTGSEAEIFAEIRTFLPAMISLPATAELTLDTPLLEGGALDSLGVLNLTERLEERFGITFSDDDFTPQTFETVRSVVHFVARSRQ